MLRTFRSSLGLLLLGLLLGAEALKLRNLGSSACPFIPPFGNPVNILQVYFSRVAASLKLNSEDDVKVMYATMQSYEYPMFRYVLKYFQKSPGRTRIFYIGILSTLPSFNDMDNPDAVHTVLRYVMTTDLEDIQRILGDYNMWKSDELNCGNTRQDFADFIAQRPIGFDTAKSGGVDMNDVITFVNKVGIEQNGGEQPPAAVDFQGVLNLLKAYGNGRASSTNLPNIKYVAPVTTTTNNNAINQMMSNYQSTPIPSVMYTLPFSQTLRGDGSSQIRSFPTDPRTIRGLHENEKHPKPAKPALRRLKKSPGASDRALAALPLKERLKFQASSRRLRQRNRSNGPNFS